MRNAPTRLSSYNLEMWYNWGRQGEEGVILET